MRLIGLCIDFGLSPNVPKCTVPFLFSFPMINKEEIEINEISLHFRTFKVP